MIHPPPLIVERRQPVGTRPVAPTAPGLGQKAGGHSISTGASVDLSQAVGLLRRQYQWGDRTFAQFKCRRVASTGNNVP